MDKRRLTNGTPEGGTGTSDGDLVLVGFELPATLPATSVSVCGDFNGWQATAHPLTRLGDGRFRAEIPLPAGARWRFRYLLDGERWENDPAADDYVPNGLGAEDCVVDLTETGSLPVVDADAVSVTASTLEGPPQQTRPGHTGPGDLSGADGQEPQLGLQRVRLRRETWERIEAEAAARGIAPQDVIADLLEAAMSPGGGP